MAGRPTDESTRAQVRLLTSPFFQVSRLAGRLIEVTRTSKAFETLEQLDGAHAELERVLDSLPRPKLVILVDLRLAPSRNDPAFEEAMKRHRPRMFEHFARRAVLVQTAVGKLHVQRHARQDGHRDLHVFTDMGEALAFLKAP